MTDADVRTRKKLIEVALPLDDINAAASREKSIRHGHPSTLHLWWARRPLAAARAVIFAQLVDDPSDITEEFPDEASQKHERERLFNIIRKLVKWESTTDELVLQEARDEITKSWQRACADNADHPDADTLFNPEQLPPFHDPFAGGGALPLEAQRLGLEAHASDLNPVAVLINKAMIEIPPRFAGQPPVRPDDEGQQRTDIDAAWPGAKGLAEDVRYYGQWMRERAEERIGHLYPKVKVTEEMASEREDLEPYVGEELTVIAWLWARTVPSPNPAFSGVHVPLASTFIVSKKKDKQHWIEPVVDGDRYYLRIKNTEPPEHAGEGTKTSRGANFRCLLSQSPISPDHIKESGRNGQMGARLLAIVAEGSRKRVYLDPAPEHELIAKQMQPDWRPATKLGNDPRALWTIPYGITTFGDLFTDRQLVALNTFTDLLSEVRSQIHTHAVSADLPDDGVSLREGGRGATAYAEAIGVYLAFVVDRAADAHCNFAIWQTVGDKVAHGLSRQGIPMAWDFAEANYFSNSTQNWKGQVEWVAKAVDVFPRHAQGKGRVNQVDARTPPPRIYARRLTRGTSCRFDGSALLR